MFDFLTGTYLHAASRSCLTELLLTLETSNHCKETSNVGIRVEEKQANKHSYR